MNKPISDPLEHRLAAVLQRLSCPTADEIGQFRLAPPDSGQVRTMEAHLAICPHCRQELQDLDALLALPNLDATLLPEGVAHERAGPLRLLLVHRSTGRPAGTPFLLDRLQEFLKGIGAPRSTGGLALAGGLRGPETPALDLANGEGLSLSVSVTGTGPESGRSDVTHGADAKAGTKSLRLQGMLFSFLEDEEDLEVQLLAPDGSLLDRCTLDGGGFALTLPAALA